MCVCVGRGGGGNFNACEDDTTTVRQIQGC